MTIDSFTAHTLLKTITPDNMEGIADLVKVFSVGEGPTEEQINWFVANKGKRVSVRGCTQRTGVVSELNTSEGGFYEGRRYPIYVKLDAISGVTGSRTFEYGIEQLVLVKENK